ncbi:MAG: patatin-like phospholipase family protein [Acidobacteria bacterium]|nr:patatin-like phospholipase family protein [Acidobacteriota bacterium]
MLLLMRVAYLYLLRVQILGTVFLIVFPILALAPSLLSYPLLHGIFDVAPPDLRWAAMQLFILAGALIVISRAVFLRGPARFGIPPASALAQFLFSVYCAGATVALLLPLFLHARGSFSDRVVAILTGLAAGAVSVVLGVMLGRKVATWATRWMSKFASRFGPGYREADDVAPEHVLAALYWLIFLGFYLLSVIEVRQPSTLSSILDLLFVVVYFLAGAAFFFDRWRIPFLIPVSALPVVFSYFANADSFFAAQPAAVQSVEPYQVLHATASDTAVIVCAQGGGIQAAAWTAQVLTSLDEQVNLKFAPMVRLISGVSGGALGAMYVAAGYQDGKLTNHESIRGAAEASSLEAIAHALVYRDIPRLLFPFGTSLRDRGVSAETVWASQPAAPPRGNLLGAWRKQAEDGKRPAMIFNSMIAETGERFAIGTVDLPGRQPGRRQFYEYFPGFDLHPVTAARLAASFPYVSPAPRLRAKDVSGHHFVDGGYFDNYGVVSAIDFLLAATSKPGNVKRILLVEILAFQDAAAKGVNQSLRGWVYQLVAPPQALLAMKEAAQRSRNLSDLRLLEEVLRSRNLAWKHVTFRYDAPGAPLSWHLTEDERQSVRDMWSRQGDAVNQVRAFLEAAPRR